MKTMIIFPIIIIVIGAVAAYFYFTYRGASPEVTNKPAEAQKAGGKTVLPAAQAKAIRPSIEQERKAKEYLIQANAYAENRKYKEAIALYDKAISINPNDSQAYYLRGKSKEYLKFSDKEQLNRAIDDYNKAIELDPKNSDAYFWRGNAKRISGDPKDAIKDYTTAINIKPNFAEAYYNRGDAKNKAHDYAGAIEDWNMTISLKPSVKEHLEPNIRRTRAKLIRESAPPIKPKHLKKK